MRRPVGFALDNPEEPEATKPEAPEGIRADRLAAWEYARASLGDLNPTPADVLQLAAFLTGAEEEPTEEEAEEEEDEPEEAEDEEPVGFFDLVTLADRWPPVQLLRRFLP